MHANSAVLNSRIQQQRVATREKKMRAPVDFAGRLKDELGQHRQTLIQRTEQTVDWTETHLKTDLGGIAAEFELKLSILGKLEAQLHLAFEDQLLQIGPRTHNSHTDSRTVTGTVGERMLDLSDILQKEDAALEDLWNQWTTIQAGIIGLAIEVLGPDRVNVEDGQLMDPCRPAIEVAMQKHTSACKRYQDVQGDIESLKKDAVAIKDRAEKTVKEQQEAWRINRKKMLLTINQAIKAFEIGDQDMED